MKNIRLYLYLLVSVLCFCCNSNNKKAKFNTSFEDRYTLIESDTKIIKLDSLTDPYKENHSFYEDLQKNKSYLYLLGRLDNSLQIYDWNTGNLISKVKLETGGPEGVGTVSSILAHNVDSVFILASYDLQLSLLNSSNKLLKKRSLIFSADGKDRLGEGVFPSYKQSCPMFLVKNKMILGGYPSIDPSDKNYYTKGYTSMTLNLTNGKLSYLTKFPQDFIDKDDNGYKLISEQIYPSQAVNYSENTYLISYSTADFIERINLSTNKKEEYYAGGRSIDDIEWARKSMDVAKEFKYFVKQPNYSGVYYDKYRQIYLRVLDIPNPEKIDEFDGRLWTRTIIIILDKNLKKVGEVPLPFTYSMPSIIIAKDGIYIRKYVEDENKMVFTCFKLEAKK